MSPVSIDRPEKPHIERGTGTTATLSIPGVPGPPGPGGSDMDVAAYVNTAGTQTRTAVDARAQATLDTHLNDTTDAHDATAISYAGSANLAANNVEAALDELDAEKADVGHTHGGTWATPTLQNSWVPYGDGIYADPRYTKIAGVVHLDGLIKNGVTTPGTTVLTLPAGFRPSRTLVIASYSSTGACRFDVSAVGVVSINVGGSATFTSLHMSFPAEA